MADNLIEAQYDITNKSKMLKFYQENKILIYSIIFFIFGTGIPVHEVLCVY